MQTMLVRNGDLVLSGGELTQCSGTTKVQQDLSIALREALGVDKYHPQWGSLLGSYIGTSSDGTITMMIESEVRRVIANYQTIQTDKLNSDRANGFSPRYGLDEVVSGVTSVTIRQNLDEFDVAIGLRVVSGQTVTLITTAGAG